MPDEPITNEGPGPGQGSHSHFCPNCQKQWWDKCSARSEERKVCSYCRNM